MTARRHAPTDAETAERLHGHTPARPDGGSVPRALIGLQRGAGNRAVSQLVQRTASGPVGPVVQRKLFAAGDAPDVKAFVGMLGPASGFVLAPDPKTTEVTPTSAVLRPPSFVLASRLATIMNDGGRHARIHLGRNQEGVGFGAFPSDASNPVQELRIDHFQALEQGVPGAGVVKLAREIIENYEGADQLGTADPGTVFGAAHEKAVEAEDAIGGELDTGKVKSGGRRNTFSVEMGPKSKPFLRFIEAHENDFLIWDQSFDGKSTVSNARKAPKDRIASFTIEGFDPSSTTVPRAAAGTISALVDAMKKNPTASATVQGFADLKGPQADNTRVSDRWAQLVVDDVIDATGNVVVTNWRRFDIVSSDAPSRNRVVVALDAPFGAGP